MNETTIKEISCILSPAERLKKIDTAINAVLVGGQSYSIGSRKLERAQLSTLLKMREYTLSELADDNTSLIGDTYVAVFDRR